LRNAIRAEEGQQRFGGHEQRRGKKNPTREGEKRVFTVQGGASGQEGQPARPMKKVKRGGGENLCWRGERRSPFHGPYSDKKRVSCTCKQLRQGKKKRAQMLPRKGERGRVSCCRRDGIEEKINFPEAREGRRRVMSCRTKN